MSNQKLLLYGALAVGGYLVWKSYQAQQAAAAAQPTGLQQFLGALTMFGT